MTMRLSNLYGIDIYSEGAGYVGKIYDVILNMETGEVVRVTTEPLSKINALEAKNVLQKKSVMYKRVKSVRDIMIVGKVDYQEQAEELEQPEPAKKTKFLRR